MTTVKTAQLYVKGNLVENVKKAENIDKESGEVKKAHNSLQFLMITQKGLEILKCKDTNGIYKEAKKGTDLEVPVRVTTSNMGNTYYEVVELEEAK